MQEIIIFLNLHNDGRQMKDMRTKNWWDRRICAFKLLSEIIVMFVSDTTGDRYQHEAASKYGQI